MTNPFQINLSLDFGQLSEIFTLQGSITNQGINLTYTQNGQPFTLDLDFSDFQFPIGEPAPGAPFSKLIVFGDSLSDPGNVFKFTNRPPSPPYFEGRFSNGPIWVDSFAPSLGLENAVINFALGGSKTGRDNTGNANLAVDILPGLLNQIDLFEAIAGIQGADPNALYVVWAGGNDFQDLANNPQNAEATVRNAVSNIASAITTLADLGAENIVVPNALDFGLTPLSREQGISSVTTQLSIAFNQALDQTLATLEQNLGLDLIEVDLFSLSQRIAATPGEFGFTNLSDPLIEQTNPVNPAGYFWWDNVHPTTQVHQLIAETIQSAVNAAAPRLPSLDTTAYPSVFEQPFAIPLAPSSPLAA